jgi:hypothetical protein
MSYVRLEVESLLAFARSVHRARRGRHAPFDRLGSSRTFVTRPEPAAAGKRLHRA